jgi:hypothetical protein
MMILPSREVIMPRWIRFRVKDTHGRLDPMLPDDLFKRSHDVALVAAPPEMIAEEKAYIDQYRCNTSRPKGAPLLGLALSGGGIRSASIALGVMQALAAAGQLKKFDYLSTVSGGGYIGSSLTWFTSKLWPFREGQDVQKVQFGTGEETGTIPVFPFGTRGPVTPPRHPLSRPERLLRYLSHHANYLEPTKGLSIVHPLKGINILAGLAVVLRGIVVNLFIWLTLMASIFLIAILVAPEDWELADGVRMPGFFCLAILAGAIVVAAFCLVALVYSLLTGVAPGSVGDYAFRRRIDRFVPLFLIIAGMLLAIGLIPVVDHLLEGWVKSVGLWSIAGGVATGLWTFWQSRHADRRAPSFAAGLVAPIGAFLILYGTALFAYQTALAVASGHPNIAFLGVPTRWGQSLFPESAVASVKGIIGGWLLHWSNADPKVVLALFLVACGAALTGWFANLNYTSLHRYYRDRLMESFLPDATIAVGNTVGPTVLCDRTRLADVCRVDRAYGPYHLINCNVMLNDSDARVWNLRGGDSFVMAPRYCGSSATGWIATGVWTKDSISLATAMSISGAAANPGTGTGGVGPMRNQLVSILMAMLNLRLGCWMPNPMYGAGQTITPNHFFPGLIEMLGWGRREDSRMLPLTDGGHFDNLGLYELIRRKVRLIVVSDGTADPGFAFSDLLTLLPRLREDFGATITFDRPTKASGAAPDGAPAPLDFTLPHLDPVAQPRYPAGVALAQYGYAVAKISYADGTTGTLIYLKAAVVDTMDLEVLGYKGKTPDFPNESTLDQFYSEEKFEVHRAVGFSLTQQMLSKIKTHEKRHPDVAVLDDPPPNSGLPSVEARAAE